MKTWSTEDVLWTLHKGERTAEARVGIHEPELRIYTRHGPKAKFDVMWSRVMKDSRAAKAMAQEKRLEFEATGWTAPVP